MYVWVWLGLVVMDDDMLVIIEAEVEGPVLMCSCGMKADEYLCCVSGEVFDYLVAHGRMKEKEARSKFRQVSEHD